MENPAKKRLSAGVALVLLSPALLVSLSGCGSNDCDDNRATTTTSDDCGVGGRSRSRSGGFFGGGFFRGGSGSSSGSSSGSGAGRSSGGVRSGGFGSTGRGFSGGS